MSEVLVLYAGPYDPDLARTQDGPPHPFGISGFGPPVTFDLVGGIAPVYAADHTVNTEPTDSPANKHIAGALQSTFNFQHALFTGAEPTGKAAPGLGVIELINNGDFDQVLPYGWDGRAIKLYRGTKGAAFSTYSLVFEGTANGIEWDESRITIRLRDREHLFERDLQSVFYGGGGGADGGADVEGQPKPHCYGECYNVPAVAVDPSTLLYQVHDRAIQAVDAVRDKGVALTNAGDDADSATLLAASIAAGQFRTCLAEGLFRLGGSPGGTITADVRGDAYGGSYVETTGAIVRRIVTTRLGTFNLIDPDDLDTAAFTQIDSDVGGPVGYFTTSTVSIAAVLDALLSALAGYWYMTRLGVFTLGVLKAPSGSADFSLARAEVQAGSLRRTGILPRFVTRMGWRRMWRVQSADELAGSVSDADRALYGNEWRYAVSQDSTVRASHPLARDVSIGGFFADEADAATEAARQQILFGERRDLYTTRADVDPLARDLAEICDLEGFTRFGWSDPEKFTLVGMQADLARGETVLTLWG